MSPRKNELADIEVIEAIVCRDVGRGTVDRFVQAHPRAAGFLFADRRARQHSDGTGEHGAFVAHHYRHSPLMSTFIVECGEATWKRAGLDRMDDAELDRRIDEISVFARVAPEHKIRLVAALQRKGNVVAMTGDGVNDAPALEAAHIGIAMGRKGTDVAREAADLVLLDDSFVSIVGGVRLGRRIFTNLRRALIYITAIHIPIAGLALTPVLLGLPPLLYPMHVEIGRAHV